MLIAGENIKYNRDYRYLGKKECLSIRPWLVPVMNNCQVFNVRISAPRQLETHGYWDLINRIPQLLWKINHSWFSVCVFQYQVTEEHLHLTELFSPVCD